MKKAVIYARYSSDRQKEESIEAQIRACREYAEENDLQIVRTYEDRATSAKNDRRPEFQSLMRSIDKGEHSVVLIHKYNRFARRMVDHVVYEDKLNRAGIDLIAVAEDFGQGKESLIVKNVLRSLSEYYNMDLADETRKGLKEGAEKALHNGGYPPFGYDVVERKYIINDFEAGWVKKMFECAYEKKGFTDLIEEMEKAGVRGKRGKPIKYPQIYEILRNEKYTGVYIYTPKEHKKREDRRTKEGAIRKEGALPEIIPKAIFEEVQTIMNERKQNGKKNAYLCSGLVYCECGAKMHGYTSKKGDHEYRKYGCSKKCGMKATDADLVESAARNYLKALLSEKNQKKIITALDEYQKNEGVVKYEFERARDKRIRALEEEKENLIKNLSTGLLSEAVIKSVNEKIEEIDTSIEGQRLAEAPKEYTAEYITQWLNSIKESPDDAAIQLLIARIDIKNTTDISIESTLASVVGKIGCGDRI